MCQMEMLINLHKLSLADEIVKVRELDIHNLCIYYFTE